MAAAARQDDSERAIQEIQRRLANLLNRCGSPSDLERNISKVRAEVKGLKAAVQAYQRIALPPSARAAKSMVQNIEDCVGAFYDFALLRDSHTDVEHLQGRVSMTQFVRASIEAMIDDFQ